MKRIACFALAALMAVACQRELVDEKACREPLDEEEFYATIEAADDPDTGTKVFADENMKVLWNADDRIAIFNKYTLPKQYRFKGNDGDNAGAFGKVPVEEEDFEVGNDLDCIYAVYPYDEQLSISNVGVLNVILPARQVYKENSFVIGANTMVSVTEDTRLRFRNAGGYLAFKFYGDNVKVSSITLEGNNQEKLSGAARISMEAGGSPAVAMQASATESVTLVCEEPVTIGSSKTDYTEFWFVIPPTTFTQGFTVTVTTDKGGTFSKSVSANFVVGRNSLKRMSALEVVPEGGEMVPPDNEIWYVTADGAPIVLEASYSSYNSTPFDSEVVSHTYENGKGIIRCAGPITVINEHVFGNFCFPQITQLYLPNSIKQLKTGALNGLQIEELKIPDNLQTVGSYALHLPSLRRFTGKHTSADGHCVILEEGYMPYYGSTLVPVQNYMPAFAPVGVTEYTLPDNVEILGGYVFWYMELKSIHFNEGLQAIMGDCFANASLDCEIVFPSTLESLDTYAFRECTGIKGFYGNEKFHTADHMCLTAREGKWLVKFVGMNLTEYTVPDGIIGIENYTFSDATNLRSVTFPSSLESLGAMAFRNCPNLEMLYGDCVTEDHRAVVFGTTFSRLVVTKGITQYTVPEGITALAYKVFYSCDNLEEVTLPDSVKELGGYDFASCPDLKKVTLSANLESVRLDVNPFLSSRKLEAIYFRSFTPPAYSDTQFYATDCEHLTVYVPEETLEMYKVSGWKQYAPYMVGYKYDDIGEWNPDYYISTDMSQDGEVTTLQTATVGQGIQLVLMGDAYSDREIADGSYAKVMRQAMDAFFSEEPYKSFRERFTVSVVNVVSQTEGYEHGGQSLSTAFGEGTYVYGNDDKVMDYARRVVSEEQMGETLIIVMMNKDAYAGTCFMYYPSGEGDFGNGLSIAYFPASSDVDTFGGLVSHEAGGHGFSKLADEYAYEYVGHVDEDEISFLQSMDAYGWNKNVDLTDDPLTVKWAAFIADNRYAAEKIGCYEGADTFWTGVWRPTENSIMRHNWGGFNAPSRYAIWNRIGKLSNGTDWNGTFEDFVSYDVVNRSAAAVRQAATRNCVEKLLPPLHRPVIIPHAWNAK